jgi:5-methylcytosine-specific restriction protein A
VSKCVRLANLSRHEFSKATKKAALERSGGYCEAIGPLYGLPSGQRCNRPLVALGVEYDHYPLPAHAEDSNTKENCVCACPVCHAFKTANYDIPAEAKIKRVRRAHGLIEDKRKPKKKIKSKGFQPGHRPFQRRK